MDYDFLAGEEIKNKEAKWNLFRFQDHLLSWISVSANYFQQRDYPNSFEALTNVYTDVYGFLTEPEQTKLDELFKKVKNANDGFITYNINWIEVARKVRNQAYLPPGDVYQALLEFRKELLSLMTKYQLTIPQVKKSGAGAGSQ